MTDYLREKACNVYAGIHPYRCDVSGRPEPGSAEEWHIDRILRALHEASLEGERRGIERAARVCDEEGAEWDSDAVQTYKNYAAHAATRIRALATTAETGKEA